MISLGYVSGDRLKSIAYSVADLFVFPTRADNLPLVLQESMACGTPMVSFNIGGVPDLVRPQQTGLLAKPEDTEDFTQKIIELLEDNSQREKLSQTCREIALKSMLETLYLLSNPVNAEKLLTAVNRSNNEAIPCFNDP